MLRAVAGLLWQNTTAGDLCGHYKPKLMAIRLVHHCLDVHRKHYLYQTSLFYTILLLQCTVHVCSLKCSLFSILLWISSGKGVALFPGHSYRFYLTAVGKFFLYSCEINLKWPGNEARKGDTYLTSISQQCS